MASGIHGAKFEPDRQHPVLDIRHWEAEFRLKDDDRNEGNWIQDPQGLAHREQAVRLASQNGELGPSVPSDVFVWADTELFDRQWLTRIGGRPWREKKKPWPKSSDGVPLVFLGQICFADSADTLPCKLPGDVALIFGTAHRSWVSATDDAALEWSPLRLEHPEDGFGVPWNGELPYRYQGVIHRTVQYTSMECEPAFRAAGFKGGGDGLSSMQATSIGAYADLPQGWPFTKGDGKTLIATLSSFYFRGPWPLCDVPSAPKRISPDGREFEFWNRGALEFGVGDAGCIWIYRDKDGEFKLDEACG